MSLTSFLNNPDVRKKFREEFPRQPVRRKLTPLAPPLTNNNSLVGTAFDYLLRFYLERLNPNAQCSAWVAENVPAILEDGVESARDRHIRGQWAIPRNSRARR